VRQTNPTHFADQVQDGPKQVGPVHIITSMNNRGTRLDRFHLIKVYTTYKATTILTTTTYSI